MSLQKSLIFSFKLLVSAAVVYVLGRHVYEQEGLLVQMKGIVGDVFRLHNLPWLFVALMLAAANWGLEVARWKLLSEQNWKTSGAEVLKGLWYGAFLPQMLGEALGRIGAKGSRVAKAKKWGRGSVFLAGVVVFGGVTALPIPQYLMIGIVLVGLTAGLAIDCRLMVLTLGRYLTFLLQFLLFFHLLQVPLPFVEAWKGIAGVLAAKTFLPVMGFLADLGLRESLVILYFEGAVHTGPVLVGSFLVWVFNICLPSIVAGFYFWKLPQLILQWRSS